jgi:retron-type reverse transcriptase
VVDIDITKFFDHVNHDILMTEIRETVGDKRVKRLIGKYLRAGVLIEGVKVRVEEGTPQGGPLTPFTQSQTLNSRIS